MCTQSPDLRVSLDWSVKVKSVFFDTVASIVPTLLTVQNSTEIGEGRLTYFEPGQPLLGVGSV